METEVRKKYRNDGTLCTEYSYLKNGLRSGLQKYYYSNTNIGYKYYMKYGITHGMEQIWYFDVRREYLRQFKNNFLNGLIIKFNYSLFSNNPKPFIKFCVNIQKKL